MQWVYNEVVLTDEYRNHIGYITDTLPDYWTRKKLLFYTWGSCVLGCATSYRSHLIKDIWPADDFAPAHDSWIQLVIYPAKRRYIPKVLQEYRQHSQNVSGFTGSKTYEKKASETLAIQNNLKYLESLFRNSHLQGWKRIFLFIVYVAKNIRLLFT